MYEASDVFGAPSSSDTNWRSVRTLCTGRPLAVKTNARWELTGTSDVLFPVADMRRQARGYREQFQLASCFFSEWQRECLADLQMVEERPRSGIDAAGSRTALAQCLHFGRIRLARDNHDFGCRKERLGQPRRAVGDDRIAVPCKVEELFRIRIVQIVMRFIQQNAMRQAGPASKNVQRR